MRDVNADILQAARQGADVLLPAGMAWFGGYRIAQELGLPSIGLALQPAHPTSQFPPPGLMAHSLGCWGNRARRRRRGPARWRPRGGRAGLVKAMAALKAAAGDAGLHASAGELMAMGD